MGTKGDNKLNIFHKLLFESRCQGDLFSAIFRCCQVFKSNSVLKKKKMKRERLVLCCVPHACDACRTLYIIAFISIAGVLRDISLALPRV